MAGDWIKMRGNLWDDPRIARLCDLTDQGEASIIGALYWLWASADQHTEDGFMAGLSCRQIDRKTGVQGFSDALIAVGWIKEEKEGISVVNFDEHNGQSAKRRATEAKRKAGSRKASASNADKKGTQSGSDAELEKEEEKRREEKEKNKDKPKTKLSPRDLVDRFGISQQMAHQFAQIRKDKKLTMTPIAMDALEREFTKAGMTNQQGIAMCCENSWGGYKASWGRENNTGNQNNGGGRPSHKPFEL